jgi:hypothetical protein
MIILKSQKTELPESIVQEMQAWRDRECLDDVPQSYVDFHADLAKEELKRISSFYGLDVVIMTVNNDGWFDGMNLVTATVRTRTDRYVLLSWHDGNQGFMVQVPCGEQSILTEKDLA